MVEQAWIGELLPLLLVLLLLLLERLVKLVASHPSVHPSVFPSVCLAKIETDKNLLHFART